MDRKHVAAAIENLERANGVIPSGMDTLDRLVNQLGQARQQRGWYDLAIQEAELVRQGLVGEALYKSFVEK